jgi:hypothetical protein
MGGTRGSTEEAAVSDTDHAWCLAASVFDWAGPCDRPATIRYHSLLEPHRPVLICMVHSQELARRDAQGRFDKANVNRESE